MTFNANGTYQYNGGTLCNAEDNLQTRIGSWVIDFQSNLIIFDKGTSDEYKAEIISLTENELRLKGKYLNLEIRGRYVGE